VPPSLRLATNGAEETRAVGQAIASVVEGGDVFSLTGDLGAGKTTLVQGAARGLGVRDPVLSPTFTLVRQYRGEHPVYHLDIYRLDRVQDVLDLGFEEMLDQGGVVFVEWGDAIRALLPEEHLEIAVTMPADGDLRLLALSGSGGSWGRRWERLEAATAPWREA
jgi:tRNA threonylcarbamoyladenosine biosynthesis protein TsaE